MPTVHITVDGVELSEWIRARQQEPKPKPMRDWARERELVEAAYSDYLSELKRVGGKDGIPHCDDLVLHAPGKCVYCDLYPNRQRLRAAMNIAFTGGRVTKEGADYPLRPCPASVLRPVEKIERWYGNVPALDPTGRHTTIYDDPREDGQGE